MTLDLQALFRESEELYERHGKPLEAVHWGSYVAICADGRTVLGHDLDDVSERALELLGPGSFIFKVGDREVGRWR